MDDDREATTAAVEPTTDRTAGSPVDGLPGHPPSAAGMAGPMGPAITTEAAGDPDASSQRSAGEGGAAAGAVVGALVAGPIGLAAGAVLGGVAGAVTGPAEPVARPGDGRVDPRADREAAYDRTRRASPSGGRPRPTSDPLTEEHAVHVPVVDALTGHGESPAAAHPSKRGLERTR